MIEKLVELLNNSFAAQYEKRGLLTAPHTATDLIANGVTFAEDNNVPSKWILVKDRLPEVFVPVLVKYLNYNDGSASPTYVDTAVLLEGDVWYWWEGDLADCDNEVKCTITHWMPLPQPPKGE